MTKFSKKPQIVDAIQWTGTTRSLNEIIELAEIEEKEVSVSKKMNLLTLKVLENKLKVELNNWVVKDSEGVIISCDHEEFTKEYSVA